MPTIQVWINIFVLDMAQFILDNLRLLNSWQEVFLESLVRASERKAQARTDPSRFKLTFSTVR